MSTEAAVEFAPFEVPAGTAVGAAMRELNLPNKGRTPWCASKTRRES